MKIYLLLSLIFSFYIYSISSVPISQCMTCKAQGTEPLTESGSCGYGSYDGMSGPGVYTATLNEVFYDAGIRCGDCLEITGPNGTTTVKAVNFCKDCPSDSPFFMMTQTAYSKISSDPVVYDAGFRRVSCSSSGPIGLIVRNDSSEYYVKVLIFNNNVGISTVTIQGKDAKSSILMQRQNGSSEFAWTNPGQSMKFPATITITSNYGDKVSWSMAGIEKMKVFNANGNFPDPKNEFANGPQNCALSQTPATIYNDSLAEGFDTFQSKSYADLNTTDFSEHNSGKASLRVTLVGNQSHLSLSRSGNFDSTYFTGIKFAVKCDQAKWEGLTVYLSNSSSSWSPSKPITKEWSVQTVLFKSIAHTDIVKSINFGNKESSDVTVWLDDISFIVDQTKINNLPRLNITTSGMNHTLTSGISSLSTSTSTSNNGNDNNEGDITTHTGNTASSSIVYSFTIIVFLNLLIIFI